MAKTDNPSLAKIECDACGSDADIKQRRNGKKLFYLHCSKCGLDQRSGAKIQALWSAVINGAYKPPEHEKTTETENTEQAKRGEPSSENSTAKASAESSPNEWQPSTETTTEKSTNKTSEVSSNDNSSAEIRADKSKQEPSKSSFGFVKIIGTITATMLIIARARN